MHPARHLVNVVSARQASVFFAVALLGASALAQTSPTNMIASKAIVLGTKTPLGDAAITLPAGTVITNFEIAGDKVVVRQGPFTASVNMSELVVEASPSASPSAPPNATAQESIAGQNPGETPAASATPDEPATTAEDTPSAATTPSKEFPDWLVPAVGGALVAYAVFATVALLRSRRRRRRAPATTAKNESGKTPVVALPSKSAAKPAVVADGGRAIACPLCGKNIPLDKVTKGRNVCPTCREVFVVE